MDIINNLPSPNRIQTVEQHNIIVNRTVFDDYIKANTFVSKSTLGAEIGVSARITDRVYGIALDDGSKGDVIRVAIHKASQKY